MDPLSLAGKTYSSRLLVGTGKYKDFEQTRLAIEASGAEIVTVAIRRTNIGQDPNQPSLLDAVPPSKYTYLPNTAGCYTADDAMRTLRWRASCSTATTWSSWKCWATRRRLFPNMPRPSRRPRYWSRTASR
jgi:thiazole synthase